MIACICLGFGELGLIAGIVSVASCFGCWLKKKLKKHKDCKCECHEGKQNEQR